MSQKTETDQIEEPSTPIEETPNGARVVKTPPSYGWRQMVNEEAAREARELAKAFTKPFDGEAFEEYIQNHPLLSKAHLTAMDDENGWEL